VRPARLALAVWPEVCALRAQPERLAEEYRRRVPADGPTQRTTLTTLEAPLGTLRQGLARLLDSDAEALIEKHEFEPRITRLRQRIAPVAAPRQQRAEQEALDTDMGLLMGRLADFAAGVQDGLAEADWSRQREMIRALGKRVEAAHDQGNVVFRIEPRRSDPSPEKKVCKLVGGVLTPPCGVPLSVRLKRHSSRYPALRRFSISRRNRLSWIFSRMIVSMTSWSMLSKYAEISPSINHTVPFQLW